MKRYKNGFSLIEVIIAIAILAVLTLPILMYFSNAAVNTARGRDEQEANAAGQSIIEEVDSWKHFTSIYTKDASDNLILDGKLTDADWSIDTVAGGIAEVNGLKKTFLKKNVSINGSTYQTKTTIDYTAYVENGTTKYNDYNEPQLKELYSDSSVFFSESNETDMAIGDLYFQVNGKAVGSSSVAGTVVSRGEIKNGLSREIHMDINKSYDDDGTTVNENMYKLNCYFKYTYGSYSTKEILDSKEINKSKLENIYVLFKPVESMTGENIFIDGDINDLNISAGISVSLVEQRADGNLKDYDLVFAGSNTNNVKLFSNCNYTLGAVNVEHSLVNKEKRNRIGMITVDVYRENETEYNDSTRLARVSTSKTD